MLYKTSREFLLQFGLSSLSELPTLKEFEELGRMALLDNETEPVAVADGAEQEQAQPESVEEQPEHDG